MNIHRSEVLDYTIPTVLDPITLLAPIRGGSAPQMWVYVQGGNSITLKRVAKMGPKSDLLKTYV